MRVPLATASIIVFLLPSFCLAQAFETRKANVDLDVQKNRTMQVRETYAVDFLRPQHGLLRKIPNGYRSKDGQFHAIELSNFHAQVNTGDGFKECPVAASDSDGETLLKIGRADRLVRGDVTIRLSYQVAGAVKDRPDSHQTQIRWNALGPEWPTTIDRVGGTVRFPEHGSSQVSARVLVGAVGSSNGVSVESGQSAAREDRAIKAKISGSSLSYTIGQPLSTGVGVTIVAQLPNSAFDQVAVGSQTAPDSQSAPNNFAPPQEQGGPPFDGFAAFGSFMICPFFGFGAICILLLATKGLRRQTGMGGRGSFQSTYGPTPGQQNGMDQVQNIVIANELLNQQVAANQNQPDYSPPPAPDYSPAPSFDAPSSFSAPDTSSSAGDAGGGGGGGSW